MYCTYVLQSETSKRYYIGSCEDIDIRLFKHNTGQVKVTKVELPWVIVHKEEFSTRSEAVRRVRRERKIKSYKGGEAFKRLINKK
ncbi:MAG: endonuclease [Candidatus Doudnabacteria bacterium RIFCSPLOWO2_01_FULL_44_21]|uniref:Endonuclease n=1 Tax=Candidatus Doudnabacteria bacterium RIFCSPLOWO2_01_FULL_44_21 TaxID=1817841 RepID=A0A1F5Q2V1_9BACT|nr:MAG: endonuclease [Candidatus Doudnabacteria bacterium RIFCSPHIGHO2_02_FULL_43_13b]OGE96454.1 MAG: endonuclease [Candidatus Doudnabacteria bacterium RIFCSPLOWO2_01_FULL_44_21]